MKKRTKRHAKRKDTTTRAKVETPRSRRRPAAINKLINQIVESDMKGPEYRELVSELAYRAVDNILKRRT